MKLEMSKDRFSLEITDQEELRAFLAFWIAIFSGGHIDIQETIMKLTKQGKPPQGPPTDLEEKIKGIKIE